MNDLLIIIDMQVGFVNPNNKHIIPNILNLIDLFQKQNKKIVFTQFFNFSNSPYINYIGWNKMFENTPETKIIYDFDSITKTVFSKFIYSSLTLELKQYIKENNINRIFLCGLETDSCILKTAFDAFELNMNCYLVEDACFSKNIEFHEYGIKIISRNIGNKQIRKTLEINDILKNEKVPNI